MTTNTVAVPVRLDFDAHAPIFARAMNHLDHAATKQLDSAGIDHRLRELLRLRVSQLNGCAYCVDMHSKDARAVGESQLRLDALPVWRESPFFSDAERAALAFAEAMVTMADTPRSERGVLRSGRALRPRRDRRPGRARRDGDRMERHRRQHPHLGARLLPGLT